MADITTALEQFKAASKPFASLDEGGVARLASIATLVKYDPNATIVEQGQTADTFYIIIKGGVRVIAEGGDEGKEVARLGLHQFFGEMGILNDEPRTAHVRAIGETHCLQLKKEPLLDFLNDYPQILHGLGSVGVERAGKLVDAIEEE